MSEPAAREYRPSPSINSLSGKRIPVFDVPKLQRPWMRLVSNQPVFDSRRPALSFFGS